MKRIKPLFLIVLLIFITVMLTACPVVPHRFDWKIDQIERDVTYINGNTLKTAIGQGVDYFRLEGIHNEITYINFFENGTLIFKPFNTEKISGTYRCQNNGIQNTTIYITLENGDSFEALGIGSLYDDILQFEYQNTSYLFSSDLSSHDVCENQNEFDEQLKQVAEAVRYLEENPQHRGYFKPCSIILDEKGGATLISDDMEIDLYSDNIGVNAIRITDNNEVIYLDSIEEGDCYFYGDFVFSYYANGNPVFINLYYIDPLPKHEQQLPEPLNIYDIVPELKAYYEYGVKENIIVKMSLELVNHSTGYSNYYNCITNQEDIDNILAILENVTFWDYGPPSDNYLDNPYSITSFIFTDITGTLPSITISNYYDFVKIGDKYYYHAPNQFPKFIYDGSFRMFACYDYNAEVYIKNELIGYTDILESIEYIIDPIQDYSYTTTHDTRKLLSEFGEITIYDATHFRYKGQFYLVVGKTTFEELYKISE